jgi:hypothetical protein
MSARKNLVFLVPVIVVAVALLGWRLKTASGRSDVHTVSAAPCVGTGVGLSAAQKTAI